MTLTNLTIKELKTIAAENNVEVIGNKSYKATWINSIQNHLDSITEFVTEANTEALIITEMTSEEVQESVTETFETVAMVIFNVAKKTLEILTSEEAINVYKSVAKFIVITFILAFFYIRKGFLLVVNNQNIRFTAMTILYVLSIGLNVFVSKFEELSDLNQLASKLNLEPIDIFK